MASCCRRGPAPQERDMTTRTLTIHALLLVQIPLVWLLLEVLA